ncbi:hypothetical protein B0H14DRAFT_3527146 [Mycena olivaceomarginata]|nr:hypothetical protein B0H14DRAFT_3527146 [Mycena olivaceomarginata]
MPAVRRNRRLQNIVRTSLSNPVAIAAIPDPYPSDGPGLNYIVTRDLVAAYELGFIDYPTLLARREIKLGECRDFKQRLCGYRACQRIYRHEWKAYCTTPERKLTEHLVRDETCSARRPRTEAKWGWRHLSIQELREVSQGGAGLPPHLAPNTRHLSSLYHLLHTIPPSAPPPNATPPTPQKPPQKTAPGYRAAAHTARVPDPLPAQKRPIIQRAPYRATNEAAGHPSHGEDTSASGNAPRATRHPPHAARCPPPGSRRPALRRPHDRPALMWELGGMRGQRAKLGRPRSATRTPPAARIPPSRPLLAARPPCSYVGVGRHEGAESEVGQAPLCNARAARRTDPALRRLHDRPALMWELGGMRGGKRSGAGPASDPAAAPHADPALPGSHHPALPSRTHAGG